MTIEIRLLAGDDAHLLQRVAEDVFDGPVLPEMARAFLDDPRHHIVVALDAGVIVGMASAVDYVHPDKRPQLWINEVGVASSYQRRGIARRMLDALLAHARALGCTDAWVGTEVTNAAARRLYESAGGVEERFVMYSYPLSPVTGAE